MAAKKTSKKAGKAKPKRGRRSVEDRIKDLRDKIQELEERKAAREVAREPVFKLLRNVRTSLRKATALMDGRTQKLSSEFIRASRKYLNLLERELDELAGKRRRGRKPKADLGD